MAGGWQIRQRFKSRLMNPVGGWRCLGEEFTLRKHGRRLSIQEVKLGVARIYFLIF